MSGQRGMTLIELLLALALTALLGVLLASSVSLWLDARQRLASAPGPAARVLDWCDGLERRFDGLLLRDLQEARLPLAAQRLDWDGARLRWVALDGWPQTAAGPPSRLRRLSLEWQTERRRLALAASGDLDAPGQPVWQTLSTLDEVDKVVFSFHDARGWREQAGRDGSGVGGVRLAFEHAGAAYVCTFALPEQP